MPYSYPRSAPNTGLQRTALCAREIIAFLKSGIDPTAFPIYGCAAAEAQAVGWLPSNFALIEHLFYGYRSSRRRIDS